MSDSKDVKFSLRVMINKQKTKVLFAEADSDFVDVLISFLTMPLGTIVRVLKKHYGEDQSSPVSIGSLTSLYNGLSNLGSDNFWTEGCKETLLNPTSSFRDECLRLKLDISDTQPAEHFTCKNPRCDQISYRKISCTSMYYDTATCVCGRTMKREVDDQKEYNEAAAADDDGSVFAVNKASFIITDDLRLLSNTKGFFQTLDNLGISDTDVGESRVVNLGFGEIVDLLKGSLLSCTPLSDLILNKRNADTDTKISIKYEQETETTSGLKKMVLKVMVQKSTNKLLFAQSHEDFVDFLFSFLTIHLGGVNSILCGYSCFKSIDNLFRSIVIADPSDLPINGCINDKLLSPRLPHGYISDNQVLPLTEESCSSSYIIGEGVKVWFSSAKFMKGPGKYVRGSRMYQITDDLTVTPFCMGTTLEFLKGMKISLSDVKELEFEIRMEEGLRILHASLSSTSALTDGLMINPVLKKQPKRKR